MSARKSVIIIAEHIFIFSFLKHSTNYTIKSSLLYSKKSVEGIQIDLRDILARGHRVSVKIQEKTIKRNHIKIISVLFLPAAHRVEGLGLDRSDGAIVVVAEEAGQSEFSDFIKLLCQKKHE